MGRLTINDMKARSNDYFFSKNTMRFYKGAKYRSIYKNERNYIEVHHMGRYAYYEFKEDGKTRTLTPEEIEELIE